MFTDYRSSSLLFPSSLHWPPLMREVIRLFNMDMLPLMAIISPKDTMIAMLLSINNLIQLLKMFTIHIMEKKSTMLLQFILPMVQATKSQ